MPTANLRQVQNGIERRLKDMVNRTHSVSSYLNRTLFRKYQEAQVERWKTENSSQGSQWPSLSPEYLKRKRKIALKEGYRGGGNAMMVLTGKLYSGAAAIDDSYYNKVVTNTKFVIALNTGSIPYAGYAGNRRPYMKFSPAAIREWKKGIRDFITRGVDQ